MIWESLRLLDGESVHTLVRGVFVSVGEVVDENAEPIFRAVDC